MMEYRVATVADVPSLVKLRKRQLADEGMLATREIDRQLSEWFTKGLQDGTLSVHVCVDNGHVIGTATLLYTRFPPSYSDPVGLRGYLNSMYTRPECRGFGIATHLMDSLIAEAKQNGVRRLWLGASPMGRHVYMKYGFRDSDEWLELEI